MKQTEFILQYYLARPNQEIVTEKAVDWAVREYTKQTGKTFRDPDRAIRLLYQQGQLIKISDGVYKYDPDYANRQDLDIFTPEQKKTILERDGYKCAVCGEGREHGKTLHVDHIKPMSKGGKAELSNGQVLCAEHNFRKKTYSQTESGKKMFINLLEIARKEGDKKTIDFCEEVLGLYDKHDINGHIDWE